MVEVTLCSVLGELERQCCTWPAVPKDEHRAEQRQQEIEREGSSTVSQGVRSHCHLSLHLELPREGKTSFC